MDGSVDRWLKNSEGASMSGEVCLDHSESS